MANSKSIVILVGIFLFSLFIVSCGGGSRGSGGETGGGGGSPAPNISGNLNIQFSGEEGGVRRFQVPGSNGSSVHYLNAIEGEPINNRSSVSWGEFGVYRWSNFRDGMQSFRNGDLVLYEFIDRESDSYVITTGFFADDNKTYFVSVDFEAGGPNVSNIPSGLYRYNGYAYSYPRHNSYTRLGEFNMNVNFDNGSGTINFIEYDEWISLNGSFIVNRQNGIIAGNDLLMVVIDPVHNLNFEDEATIYGSFHNSGATGVSGIFYNNSDKVYGGAFAGARTDLRPDE